LRGVLHIAYFVAR